MIVRLTKEQTAGGVNLASYGKQKGDDLKFAQDTIDALLAEDPKDSGSVRKFSRFVNGKSETVVRSGSPVLVFDDDHAQDGYWDYPVVS